MAKTFKNLPPPAAIAPAKRASERDFFDLTDDAPPATIPAINPAADPATENIDNTPTLGNTSNTNLPLGSGTKETTSRKSKNSNPGNTHHTGIINNSNKIGNSASPEDSSKTVAVNLGKDVRQTFVLSEHHLEQLRDYVHARRFGGDYTYSQKQALQEALDLLFASTAPVATRPDQVKEREQERRQRIQQGRQPRG